MNYNQIKVSEPSGLYLNQQMLLNYLDKEAIAYESIGNSIEGRELICVRIGKGANKVVFWSQMHGNESTGTYSLLELLNYYKLNPVKLENLSLVMVLMLNPDGADRYTRRNALEIDLNRDAVSQSCPEIKSLFKLIKNEKPEYLFNLHDQRNIFNVKGTSNPATLAFLSPSEDFEKSITSNRLQAMELINIAYNYLKPELNNQVARFTDEFYPNATGDNLQKLGIPTILVEAGAYPKDDQRLITRKYQTLSLITMLDNIEAKTSSETLDKYNKIPENDNKLKDVIIDNITLNHKGTQVKTSVSLLKKWSIINGEFKMNYILDEIGDLSQFDAYLKIDYKEKEWTSNKLKIGSVIVLVDNQ